MRTAVIIASMLVLFIDSTDITCFQAADAAAVVTGIGTLKSRQGPAVREAKPAKRPNPNESA